MHKHTGSMQAYVFCNATQLASIPVVLPVHTCCWQHNKEGRAPAATRATAAACFTHMHTDIHQHDAVQLATNCPCTPVAGSANCLATW
jgi:hypothetical protein